MSDQAAQLKREGTMAVTAQVRPGRVYSLMEFYTC